MTDDLIARAKAALEGVTQGPWRAWPHPENDVAEMFWYVSGPTGSIILEVDTDDDASILATSLGRTTETVFANARFIAAARQLVPDLIAALEARDARIAELEEDDVILRNAAEAHLVQAMRAVDRAEAAEARVKVLEDALRSIDALDPERLIDAIAPNAMRGLVLRMGEIARTALEGEK